MSIHYISAANELPIVAPDGGRIYVVEQSGYASSDGSYDADAWSNTRQQLMPEGIAWDFTGDLGDLIKAHAEEDARIDAYLAWRVNDIIPINAIDSLPDWEAALGLPDPCIGSGGSIEERRAMSLDKLSVFQGGTRASLIIRAWRLGFVLDLEPAHAFTCGDAEFGTALDTLDDEDILFAHAPATSIRYFRVGQSRVGERLRSWGNDRLSCWLHRVVQAHRNLVITYGVA